MSRDNHNGLGTLYQVTLNVDMHFQRGCALYRNCFVFTIVNVATHLLFLHAVLFTSPGLQQWCMRQ